jgi:putative ABC transport system permease protein
MHSIWQDVRYGFRGLRKQPGFASLAVLALALGIGAATTIFSVIQNVLLDPFPYTDANKVVAFQIRDAASGRPGGRSAFQVPEFLDYQEQAGIFDGVIGGGYEDILQTTGEGTEQFNGGLVTGNTFDFLGVPALYGRTLTPEDAKPGAAPVFVMAHKMWMKHFNGDATILGRTFIFNGIPTTLVGIMPQRFTKLGADLWKPIALDRADAQNSRRYFMFQARLKPGITNQQAEATLDVVAHRLARVYPDNYPEKFTVKVVSWVDSLVAQFRQTLYTLAAAVGLLLLIACTNVANMLLARATAREKEMAIRSSIGASRTRLVTQLLVESFILAVAGAALGCVFAYFGIKALVTAIPDGMIPREAVIRLNVPVLLFSLAVAVVTALLFGLAPALQTAKSDLATPLKDAGKGVSGGFRKGRLRNALVVIEVSLSLVLLAGAGLLMRSFVKLQTVDLGFRPENILVARLPLPQGQYKTAASKQQFFQRLLPRLQALPGVTAATETSSLPPYGGIRSEVDVPGATHTEKWTAIYQLCSEGYFQTLGLQLKRGRLLSETEVAGARKVIVVNETLVNRFFSNGDALGRQVRFKMLETLPENRVENAMFEIVGVVADAKNQGIQDPAMPEAFMPYTVTGAFERGILVRTQTDPLAMVQTVRREIWAVDRNVAITLTGSLTDYLKQFSYAEPRFGLVVLGVFAVVGLVLVVLGVYSVVAYTVSRQTQEIGIRMALGAGQRDVLTMVLRMGMRVVGAGIVAGVIAALGVTRVLRNQLWGLSATDPLTMAGVVAVIACAGLCACYFPARRATRVDPVIALRYE